MAYDVSGDPSVAVGERNGLAFVWTESLGMRDLRQELEAIGVFLTGWTLASARTLSTSGIVMVGTGTNPQGARSVWRQAAPPGRPRAG
jgi:hypothetical protein